MPAKRTRAPQPLEPRDVLSRLGGWAGGSIGQAEALAGINVQSATERAALWDQFRHLFLSDRKTLFAAVMNHCAAITLERVARGELSLLPSLRDHQPPRGMAGAEPQAT